MAVTKRLTIGTTRPHVTIYINVTLSEQIVLRRCNQVHPVGLGRIKKNNEAVTWPFQTNRNKILQFFKGEKMFQNHQLSQAVPFRTSWASD